MRGRANPCGHWAEKYLEQNSLPHVTPTWKMYHGDITSLIFSGNIELMWFIHRDSECSIVHALMGMSSDAKTMRLIFDKDGNISLNCVLVEMCDPEYIAMIQRRCNEILKPFIDEMRRNMQTEMNMRAREKGRWQKF